MEIQNDCSDPVDIARARLRRYRMRYGEIARRYGFKENTLRRFSSEKNHSRNPGVRFIDDLRAALDELDDEEIADINRLRGREHLNG